MLRFCFSPFISSPIVFFWLVSHFWVYLKDPLKFVTLQKSNLLGSIHTVYNIPSELMNSSGMDETKQIDGRCMVEVSTRKERHIVSWTQEEDDTLREQINLHGTDNWAVIASNFKDKTTRQCRRRWCTYLNSDFKKGGWSPEEDMLLCEAQRIFGNRWTEIAKVVSGRTDNAVKNRFSTLCKKRAKFEALTRNNSTGDSTRFDGDSNDKTTENQPLSKKTRHQQNYDVSGRLHPRSGNAQPQTTYGLSEQNRQTSLSRRDTNFGKDCVLADDSKTERVLMKKDDREVTASLQQVELHNSIVTEKPSENMRMSHDNEWKIAQDVRINEVDNQHENLKDLIEELSVNDKSQPSWRQFSFSEDSTGTSEYSSGSTIAPYMSNEKTEDADLECDPYGRDTGTQLSMDQPEEQGIFSSDVAISEVLQSGFDTVGNKIDSSLEYGSPLQVTPLFRSLGAGIPSPKFTESERSLLLQTLGLESPSNQCVNTSMPPSCKRALLQN